MFRYVVVSVDSCYHEVGKGGETAHGRCGGNRLRLVYDKGNVHGGRLSEMEESNQLPDC